MWEESTRAAVVLRALVLMVLIATLTVVALHGDQWGPIAATSITGSGTSAADLVRTSLHVQ